nr:immunoglobulin heavy chain junction region [Macaca mulatta]MOW82765.1 immunoglobulin heavy chain junction region [Macaca mulatta]MOW86201.1 immunoglobulin heavy chain junction region [Macaca mulatta]
CARDVRSQIDYW